MIKKLILWELVRSEPIYQPHDSTFTYFRVHNYENGSGFSIHIPSVRMWEYDDPYIVRGYFNVVSHPEDRHVRYSQRTFSMGSNQEDTEYTFKASKVVSFIMYGPGRHPQLDDGDIQSVQWIKMYNEDTDSFLIEEKYLDWDYYFYT
jgi:hypothetical protein